MQQEKTKRLSCLFWALSVVCMAVIFWLSSRTADESTAQSNVFVEWLLSHFSGIGETVATLIVRKGAHCLEFTGLCVLFNSALFFTRNKVSLLAAIGMTSLYAVTDEVHQIFVQGRSCELVDWGIDTCGAVLGAIGFFVIDKILTRISQKD